MCSVSPQVPSGQYVCVCVCARARQHLPVEGKDDCERLLEEAVPLFYTFMSFRLGFCSRCAVLRSWEFVRHNLHKHFLGAILRNRIEILVSNRIQMLIST